MTLWGHTTAHWRMSGEDLHRQRLYQVRLEHYCSVFIPLLHISFFMVGTSPTERGTHCSKEAVSKPKVEVRTCFISTSHPHSCSAESPIKQNIVHLSYRYSASAMRTDLAYGGVLWFTYTQLSESSLCVAITC